MCTMRFVHSTGAMYTCVSERPKNLCIPTFALPLARRKNRQNTHRDNVDREKKFSFHVGSAVLALGTFLGTFSTVA